MSQPIDNQNIQILLKGITIPPRPQVLIDIQQFRKSPSGDLNLLADAISKDIGLSGGVLKAINSPFFGLPRKISSVYQAVVMMGERMVISIVTGLMMRGSFSDEGVMDLSAFWDTAMDVANIMTLLSRRLSAASAEDAYMLGLFHNCGVLLLYQKNADYMDVAREAYQQQQYSITEYETSVLSTNHAVVGYYIAKAWHLELPVCMAIMNHHSIGALLSDPFVDQTMLTYVCLLKMSEKIADVAHILGDTEDREWILYGDTILQYLNISMTQWQDLVEEAMLGFSDV